MIRPGDTLAYHRFLAMRLDPEIGAALRAIESMLPDLCEPVSPSTMALLLRVPPETCASIARELWGVENPFERVDWHRIIDIVDRGHPSGPNAAYRPIAVLAEAA